MLLFPFIPVGYSKEKQSQSKYNPYRFFSPPSSNYSVALEYRLIDPFIAILSTILGVIAN
jgi:hypothetical protein